MAQSKHSINSYDDCCCRYDMGVGSGEDGSDADRGLLAEIQPCPLWKHLQPNRLSLNAAEPGHEPQLSSQRPLHTLLPKGSTDLDTQVPPGPGIPWLTTNLSFLKESLIYVFPRMGKALWPTPNCRGWEEALHQSSLCFLAQHPLPRERHGNHSLWKTPHGSDFMNVLPTPFPPLLTLPISPFLEAGIRETYKDNENKHIHFAASWQQGERIPSKSGWRVGLRFHHFHNRLLVKAWIAGHWTGSHPQAPFIQTVLHPKNTSDEDTDGLLLDG